MKKTIYAMLTLLCLTNSSCLIIAATMAKDSVVKIDYWGRKVKTVYEHDNNTKTESSYLFDKQNNKWLWGHKTETITNSPSGQITYIYYKSNEANNSWVPENKDESLTINCKSVFSTHYKWDNELQAWVGRCKFENIYDERKGVSTEIGFLWNKKTNSWFINTKEEKTFFENGKISQTISSERDYKRDSLIKRKKVNYTYSCLDNSISSTKVQKWNEHKNSWQDFSFDSTFVDNSNKRTFRQYYTKYNEKTGNLDTLKTKTEITTRDSSYRAEIWWNKNHQKTDGEENRNYRDKDSLFSYNIHIKYGWDEDLQLPKADKEEHIYNTNEEIVALIRSKWNEKKKRFVIAEKETYCYDTDHKMLVSRIFINDSKQDTLCPFEFHMYTCDYPEKRFYYEKLRFNSTDKKWDYAPANNYPFVEIIPENIAKLSPEDCPGDICPKTDTLTETLNDSLKHITRGIHYLMNAHDENKQMQYKIEYAYDNDGNRVLTAYYLPGKQPDTWICIKKQELAYDNQKRPISTAYYALNYETKTLTGVGKEEKAYNPAGQKYMNAYYEWDTTTQSWKGLLKSEVRDDAKGKFGGSTFYKWNAKTQTWENRFKTQIRYDAKGNHLGSTEYIWNEKRNDWIKKPVPKVPRNAKVINTVIE